MIVLLSSRLRVFLYYYILRSLGSWFLRLLYVGMFVFVCSCILVFVYSCFVYSCTRGFDCPRLCIIVFYRRLLYSSIIVYLFSGVLVCLCSLMIAFLCVCARVFLYHCIRVFV